MWGVPTPLPIIQYRHHDLKGMWLHLCCSISCADGCPGHAWNLFICVPTSVWLWFYFQPRKGLFLHMVAEEILGIDRVLFLLTDFDKIANLKAMLDSWESRLENYKPSLKWCIRPFRLYLASACKRARFNQKLKKYAFDKILAKKKMSKESNATQPIHPIPSHKASLILKLALDWSASTSNDLQSKHLKGRLGPRVSDGHVFGSM